MLEYFGDYQQVPDFAIVKKPGQQPPKERGAAPDVLRMAADLITWTHWEERAIWEMSMGRVYWYQMMSFASAGADLDVLTEEERAEQEELLQRQASEAEEDRLAAERENGESHGAE